MKRSIIINAINQISDYIIGGLEIDIDSKSDVKMVYARNPRTGKAARFTFRVPAIGFSQIVKWEDIIDKQAARPQAVTPVTSLPDKGMPTVATINEKKHNSRWWARFNFEKNIMKMTLLALQDRYPAEVSFPQDVFAAKLAGMMGWKVSTARKHITQAAKMGLVNRSVIGTAYHVTGYNDVDAKTLQEELAERQLPPERMPMPGENYPVEDTSAPGSAIAHEGRPLFELELEKAVDETLLP